MFRAVARVRVHGLNSEDLHSSYAISKQLKDVLSKEIVGFEFDVLSAIDKIVNCSEGIGRRNPLGIWVALWILILAYQELMLHHNYSRRTSRFPG
jgi:hypothetical protein